MQDSCFICNKYKGDYQIPGGLIFENEYVAVTHIDFGEESTYLGYIMIDLKRHAPTLAEMTDAEAAAFGLIMAKVSRALKESEHAEHIYAMVSGNAVSHLHMHIVPRYPGTPKEYWGPRSVVDWPEAPVGGKKELEAVCARLKAFLEREEIHA